MDPLSLIIVQHEGMRLKPYADTLGNLTIGVGRNLSACGISQNEALFLLQDDITCCELELLQYSWYSQLDDVRKGVLIELVFNMGLSRTLGFVAMITALKVLDYKTAAKELLNSDWAVQVGSIRSNNMASRLRTGTY